MSQLNFRENLVENTTVYLSSLGYSVKRIDIKVSDGDVHVFLEMPIEATKNATVIEYNLRKFFNQMPDIETVEILITNANCSKPTNSVLTSDVASETLTAQHDVSAENLTNKVVRTRFSIPKLITRAISRSGIFHLIFFVTARCNARCKMCFYLDQIENANKYIKDELTVDQIAKVFKSIGYIPYISLSGGEPFMRKDLFDVVKKIVQFSNPAMISIPTNGGYTKRVRINVERMLRAYPGVQFDVQLSIDAFESTHDEIRRVPGLFQKMLDTYKALYKLKEQYSNLAVKITITYSNFNQHDVNALIDFVEGNMDCDRIILSKVHGNADGKENLDMSLFRDTLRRVEKINWAKNNRTRSQITSLSLRVKKGKEALRESLEAKKRLGRFCGASKKILVLSEYGIVYPCEVISRPIGNLKNYDFDLAKLLRENADQFIEDEQIKSCHCDWGCAQNIAFVTHPKHWYRAFMT